jgi:DNA polymerase V
VVCLANRAVSRHQASSVLIRVKGDSMIDAGIHDGDIVVVERCPTAADRQIVVAIVDGEITLKRLKYKHGY